MSPQDIAEYTALELRGQATDEHIKTLAAHPSLWLDELINLKRRTETQMTSCNTRKFRLYCDYRSGELSLSEYNTKLLGEKVWKTNASRFIQQVEAKIASLKHYEPNLSDDQEHSANTG